MVPFSIIFVLRMNVDMGIPDLAMIIFTSQISGVLSNCFIFLPLSTIFGKVTPQHIEATSFALLAGVSNLRGQVSSHTGAFINDTWVGCTQSDLSNFWKLECIQFFCSLLPLLIIGLLPTRKDIDDFQAK